MMSPRPHVAHALLIAVACLATLPVVAQDAATAAPAPADGALSDEEQSERLLDRDDPAAKEGEVVGARGIDPGWKDSRVAERAPNIWGQTGLVRTTSARANKSGYFDIGLHGRGFYMPDFIVPGGADENVFLAGSGTFGVSLFDIFELGLALSFANNQNSLSNPQITSAAGDFAPSLKIDLTAIPALFGFSTLPVAAGFDLRGFLPTRQDAVGPDLGNFSLTGTFLLTFDFYEKWDIPVKTHINAGYTFQAAHYLLPPGERDRYYLQGVPGHLFALTTGQWWYDQGFGGLAVEFPFPYVTPFIELWAQTAINVPTGYGAGGGDYNYLNDTHTMLTPGLRFSLRGLSIDLAADVGLTGNGGYLTPDVNNLVDGQPINPLWAVQMAVSYTFSPFVAETQVEVREKKTPLGQVKGCVVDDTDGAPVEDAFVEFTGSAGPRIVVDDKGCFESPKLETGMLVVKVKHPEYKPEDISVEIVADQTADAKVRLVPAPRFGRFKGNLTNEADAPVDGTIDIVSEEGASLTPATTTGGEFDIQLKPGKYQIVIKSEGYLQQGAAVVVEPLGRTIRNFVLKPVPKRRISVLTKDKIEITTKVPFEYNKARLLRAAEFILDDVVDLILANPQVTQIRIEGHTDNIGEATYNQDLSRERAESVMEYLVGKGVPKERLVAEGYGFSRPIAANDTEEGRAKNRRVEFVIVEQAADPTEPAATETGTAPTTTP
jgi:outer membrane protein OmpA-like peptidoglycan-associated protein